MSDQMYREIMLHHSRYNRSLGKRISPGLRWLKDRADGVIPGGITEDCIEAVLYNRLLSHDETDSFTPPTVVDFLVSLVDKQGVSTILDPTCGSGLLLAKAYGHLTNIVKEAYGCEIDKEIIQIPKALVGNYATICSDNILSCTNLPPEYDLIITHAPSEQVIELPDLAEFEEFKKVKSSSTPIIFGESGATSVELGEAILVWASHHISQNGTAIVMLPSDFLENKDHVFHAIHQAECQIQALIYLPSGSLFDSFTPTYVVVLRRGNQGPVFIGEYRQNQDHLNQLIYNYKKNAEGPTLSLGRKVKLDSFPGFEVYAAKERFKRFSEGLKWSVQPAQAVVLNSRWVKGDDDVSNLASVANGMYLRPFKNDKPATLSPDIIPTRGGIVHLELDPKLVDAKFLVHWFNKTAVGRATLELIGLQNPIPLNYLIKLLEENLLIPSMSEQKDILSKDAHIQRIKTETKEQENILWSGTGDVNEIGENINMINQKDNDSFGDWIETLPFPLASILWRYHYNAKSPEEHCEALLEFFETMAAFIATIHLSAFMSNSNLWSKYGPELYDAVKSQGFDFEKPMFGYWRIIIGKLSKICREMLDSSNDDLTVLQKTYCNTQNNAISMLCSKKIINILQSANQFRNELSHGSVKGVIAERLHNELYQLLEQTRSVFSTHWREYELIQPGSSNHKKSLGLRYYNEAKLLTGPHTQFKVVKKVSAKELDGDRLCLYDKITQTGLELVPYVRLTLSKDKQILGCFIFNSLESNQSGSDQFRYDSYHLEEESQITIGCSDMKDVLDQLKQFESYYELPDDMDLPF